MFVDPSLAHSPRLLSHLRLCLFFFFNDTATTEIYTLSLHDALPICRDAHAGKSATRRRGDRRGDARASPRRSDRKSTRLNSSHRTISYAVFCLKKKKKKKKRKKEKQKAKT